jgi:HlyD family secretion protein
MKRWIVALLVIALVGAGAGAYYIRRGGPDIQVNTSAVTLGDIVDTVGATGTLQAVTTVQVGSQVSGNIQWLGADFNSIVRKGQQIARLDPSLFQTQVEQARANLTRAKADVERNRVGVADAQIKFNRAQELAARSLMPQSDLDAAKTTLDAARAQLQSAEAQVVQAQAAVNQADVNLEHTVITAPIDGIVTSRNVDVGQTVAASLQSPTLFIIAADLTKMQVNANIDEADVGRIRPAQRVTFRVDAYPTEEFTGTVAQIRLQPTVVQNVTTYGTVIDVPNEQLKLKPGMTANVKIEIARRNDVLRVPNAALRFRPAPESAPTSASPTGGDRSAPTRQSASGAPVQFRGGEGSGTPPRANGGDAPVNGEGARQGRADTGSGRGGGTGDGGRGGSGGDAGRNRFDPSRMMERFKGMSPDEQKQFVERMKSRGVDVSAFKKQMKAAAPVPSAKPKYGAPQSAQTIDALFGPLPVTESRGRAWLFVDRQLKPVNNLRLGISDGTNTELLSSELAQNQEVVTGVTGLGSTRTLPTPGGTGNPLMPGGGRGPGGFGGGGGRGR